MALRFTLEEVQRLVRLASSAPAGRTLEEAIFETLKGLQELVPHASTDMFLLEPARERGQPVYVAGIPEKDLEDYVGYYRHHDPMGKFLVGSPDEVKTLSDAATPTEVQRTEYSDLLGRHSIVAIAGWSQWIGEDELVAIGLHRDRRMGDFKPRERAVLSFVLPLLVARIREHYRPAAPLARLTPAERLVAELIMSGLPDRAIAGRLGVGFATVRTHIQHAFAKLRVSNRTELVHAILAATPPPPAL